MKFIVVPHPGKKEAKELAIEVRKYIKAKGHVVVRKKENAEVGVVLAGDGFMMDTLQILGPLGIACFGINLGDAGFLTVATRESWKKYIDKIIAGKYQVENRIMITAELRGKQRGPFCGDIVFEHRGSVCDFEVHVNEQKLYGIDANGVIVTTPMGSTAYCASLRGPIIRPGTEAIGIVPIAPMNLSVLPVVESADAEVKVTLTSSKNNTKVPLRGSGRLLAWVKVGEEIIIRKHETTCLFIAFDDYDFYKILREKKNFAL